MPLVGRCKRDRSGGGALRLEEEQVEVSYRRAVIGVLNDYVKRVLGARLVRVVDELNRLLTARTRLEVGASSNHGARAGLDEIEVVVVARGAKGVIPHQEDNDLAAGGQLDRVIRLRAEAQDVRSDAGRGLKKMQVARGADDGLSLDTRVHIIPAVVNFGFVADGGKVSADGVRRPVQSARRVLRHVARPVVGQAKEAKVIHRDVGVGCQVVHGLLESQVRISVGEEQLSLGSEVVDDLQYRCAFRARPRESAGRAWRGKPLEVTIGRE